MFDSLRMRIDRWQRYKRTVAELQSLSNRDLADIGISRHDIHRIARDTMGR